MLIKFFLLYIIYHLGLPYLSNARAYPEYHSHVYTKALANEAMDARKSWTTTDAEEVEDV